MGASLVERMGIFAVASALKSHAAVNRPSPAGGRISATSGESKVNATGYLTCIFVLCEIPDRQSRCLFTVYKETAAHQCRRLRYNVYLVFLNVGPKLAHALKSAPSGSIPNAFHAAGRKILSSGTLCIATGMRSMEHIVMRSAPM